MINNSALEKIKETLHKGLGKINSFEECVLLNYPDYHNIGDHLIWLGEVFYLTDNLNAKIKYTAAGISDFSGEEMERQIGKAPIILQGGGNLGDLWKNHQEFREHIISKYQDHQIVVMPQSIYFTDTSNLKKAADIFNSHPNLTLFIRDDSSYEIALKYFDNCQLIKVPDMAFQLVNLSCLTGYNPESKSSILYHCRGDKELNQGLSSNSISSLPNLVTEDWISYWWKDWYTYESMFDTSKVSPFCMQRNLANSTEWIFWQLRQQIYPYPAKFNSLYNPRRHLISWSAMHCGIYQFSQHKLIITNRLHGHILCVLLGIPHIFLANSYHKNESFYESWTHQFRFCKFVKDSSQITTAAQELLELN